MKTRLVDWFGIGRVAACVSSGRERLGAALPGMALLILFRSPALLVYRVIGLLDAGLGLSEELENVVEVDPGELDDGVLTVHELRETDHTLSSGCSGQDNHLELQSVVQLGV